MSFKLIVPGRPMGKARARNDSRRGGHFYTPTPTEQREKLIGQLWMAQGRPELGPGGVALKVVAAVKRPKRHYNADGTLSATGLENPWPISKPDIDNIEKLAMDALNGLAWLDDTQIVIKSSWRRWAGREEQEHTLIEAWQAPAPSMEVAA